MLRTHVGALACIDFGHGIHGGAERAARPQDYAVVKGSLGQPGGRLVVALRSEPKTLNPILSVDATSREVIGAMTSDLVHINHETQRTEPALAKSWTVSLGRAEIYDAVATRIESFPMALLSPRMTWCFHSNSISTKIFIPRSVIYWSLAISPSW